MADEGFGFYEISHTADWAIKVLAPDLPTLFDLAAHGMYALMGIHVAVQPRVDRSIEISGIDTENLLVSFLSELLYFTEVEGLGFDRFDIHLENSTLRAVVYGAPVAGQYKEIKAVTYHNLQIHRTPTGFSVTIVFDV